jgi:hypothetical protein
VSFTDKPARTPGPRNVQSIWPAILVHEAAPIGGLIISLFNGTVFIG